jgi:hypothetical protein
VLTNHAPDGGRAPYRTCSSEHLGDTFRSHRREQTLQLPDEIPDEVGVTVYRLDRLDQVAFAVLGESAHSNQQRLQIEQEHAGRLFRGPAACGPGVGGCASAGSVYREAGGGIVRELDGQKGRLNSLA